MVHLKISPWKFGDSELGNHHFQVNHVKLRECKSNGVSLGFYFTPAKKKSPLNSTLEPDGQPVINWMIGSTKSLHGKIGGNHHFHPSIH